MDEKESEDREAEGESLSSRKTSFNMSLGGYRDEFRDQCGSVNCTV